MPGPPIDVVPVGGLGQFGMNCTLVRRGDEALLLDAGMAFPTPDAWGIAAVVPDFERLLGSGFRLAAILLTHAHEDHIGAVPQAMLASQCPVYGSDLTLGFVRDRLRAIGMKPDRRLVPVAGRSRIEAGPFTVEFIDVTHSVPGTLAISVETPWGAIVASGDFKLDPTPVAGPATDLERLDAIGRRGVALLLLDSTNAVVEAPTLSERTVAEPFARLMAEAEGRVFVTTFSSHIHRIQTLVDAAARTGRKVTIVGRRMSAAAQIARETGRLRLEPAQVATPAEAALLPPRRSLVVAGGSQGEWASALTRIARGEHPEVRVAPGDTVVHSARPIPGNELAIGRMLDDLARQGARILAGSGNPYHVSGHASAADLAAMIDRLAPATLVPVHGTYRHLLACARIARSHARPPKSVLLAQNGDIIRLQADGASLAGRIDTGVRLLDDQLEPIAEECVRDRRLAGAGGIVVAIVVVERGTGRLVSPPEVRTRGFGAAAGDQALLAEAAGLVHEALLASPAGAGGEAIAERLTDEVRRLVRRRSGRRPLVAPFVIEV